ncbi:acyltransferase, partial [Cellulomonas sp. ACRRI]|uniref:acyltransferase family protein n=1 Tax=Cellulomonas sp. ACRRI TaxID=2918188 RepID=UPI001EF2CB7B
MTGTAPSGDRLPVLWSLNGLRAAGALLVMLYHVNSWNLQVLRGSSAFYTGVGLFFVLSGFVLTWTAQPGTTLGAFYTRRLARILPNHLTALAIGLAVTVLVVGSRVDPGTLLSGALLVQAWSPDRDVVFAVNGVAWSLSCEIAFYAAFPALLWALRRMTARTRVVVAGAALAAPVAVALAWPTLIPVLFHLPPARLPEFLLGMVAALAVREGWRPRVPAGVLLAVLAACVLGAAAVDVHPTALTAVLAAVFAPLAAGCAWGDIDGRNRWALHPAVKLGGALSFSFYLLHELVIKVVVATPVRGPAAIGLVLVASAALAFLLWRGVELPARARILATLPAPAPRLGAAPPPHAPGGRRARHSRPWDVAWSFPLESAGVPAAGAGTAAPAGAGTAAPAGVGTAAAAGVGAAAPAGVDVGTAAPAGVATAASAGVATAAPAGVATAASAGVGTAAPAGVATAASAGVGTAAPAGVDVGVATPASVAVDTAAPAGRGAAASAAAGTVPLALGPAPVHAVIGPGPAAAAGGTSAAGTMGTAALVAAAAVATSGRAAPEHPGPRPEDVWAPRATPGSAPAPRGA